jgi:hypothetical protein
MPRYANSAKLAGASSRAQDIHTAVVSLKTQSRSKTPADGKIADFA